MGDVVNLNRARKDRAGAAKKARAAENRARHGRTKAQVTLSEAEATQMSDKLDAHRREPDKDKD